MSPAVVGLIAAAAGVALILGNAMRHNLPAAKFGWYALAAALTGFITAVIGYRTLPVLWPLVAATPAAVGLWATNRFATTSYWRAAHRDLLVSRLKEAIPGWTGAALACSWAPRGGGVRDVTQVTIGLPTKTLPSKVAPAIRTVLAETLRDKWSIKTAGTIITAARVIDPPEPAAVKTLRKVLADPRCLGPGYALKVIMREPANTEIEEFSVKYRDGNAMVNTQKREYIEKMLRERVATAEGSWVINWKLPADSMHVKRSAFRPMIKTPPPKQFLTRNPDIIKAYGSSGFDLGIYGDGTPVVWRPVDRDAPHANTCGETGKGKTSWAHTLITRATALGWCVIIADFKLSDSFNGFRDWPNVHIVSNGIYENIKTIYYVIEVLNRRRHDRIGKVSVDNDVPILFIMDEYAWFAMQVSKNIWPRFKGKNDPAVPPVLTEIDQLIILCRQFRIHVVTMIQKPSSEYINPNVIFNSGKKFQLGWMPGAMSTPYWGVFEIGQRVPAIIGRGQVNEGADIREFQAYYTPDPLKARTDDDLARLAALMPPTSLYPRVVFELPDPYDITEWEQIVTAPWRLADERPDLDPLSVHYRPPRLFTYDTLKDMDPASMSVKT